MTSKAIVTIVTAASIYFSVTSISSGAPVSGAGIIGAREANSLVQDARVFCFNRRTGRFLHWGSCRRRVSSRPRVYCRYRGRFLHWGSCWR
jgi:hypothetical protein